MVCFESVLISLFQTTVRNSQIKPLQLTLGLNKLTVTFTSDFQEGILGRNDKNVKYELIHLNIV